MVRSFKLPPQMNRPWKMFVGAFAIVVATNCSVFAKPPPPEEPTLFGRLPVFKIDRGAVLYERYCAFCHGANGKGTGPNAFSLSVKPGDLTRKRHLEAKSERLLRKVLSQGGTSVGKSPEMPGFGSTLSEAELQMMIRLIRNGFSTDDE